MTSVLIYDEHCGWSPSLNASKGTGGTEVHLVQIATWLAAHGVDVIAMCHDGRRQRESDVLYVESRDHGPISKDFDVILTVRRSSIPVGYDGYARIITLVTDDPRPEPDAYAHLLGRSTLACVSEWQAGLYRALGHKCVVIPAMIDDWVYDLRVEKVPGRHACLSAWNKGTQATLDAWQDVRPSGGFLVVGSPYSEPDDAEERCHKVGAIWLGRLKPREIVTEMARSIAHVRVCEIGETFGATDAIAEAVGTKVYAYCPGDVGALRWPWLNKEDWGQAVRSGYGHERHMLPERDLRLDTVMPQWLRLIEGK